MAHFGQERGSDVADFIVPDGGKASSVADHGMVNGEWYSTWNGKVWLGLLGPYPRASWVG